MSLLSVEQISIEGLHPEILSEIAAMKNAFWREVLPDDPPIDADAVRADLLAVPARSEVQHLVARCEGHVAGLATTTFETEGPNMAIAVCAIEVAPEYRRRGVATKLLARFVANATARGCRSILSWGLRTEPSNNFWDSFGVAEAQTSRRSRVAIATVDPALMQQWRSSSIAQDLGYELRLFVGSCPDDLLERYVQALSGMHDAPAGDLEVEQPTVETRHIRMSEADAAKRGIDTHVLLALDAEGNAAGVTEISVSAHTPTIVSQQVTTTLVAHRRQGLGRWLKAEMYFHIVSELPEARLIETGNADSNEPMLAVNDAMGFAPVLSYTIRQADIAAVADALERKKAK